MPSSIRGWLAIACLLLGPFATFPANAAMDKAPRCTPAPGSSPLQLAKLERDIRANDGLLRALTARQGDPVRCTGSVTGPAGDNARWLEFAWADQSRLKYAWLQPETLIVEYINPHGLAHADDVEAVFRDNANESGMAIDWKTPHETRESNARVVEYRDPVLNGFMRLRYDRQRRLVAVWLSLAL
ncbi:hypothetical protein [Herbaspirillum sp. SJZ107]|uniref:hypothetical protein n=1 Tax=Herbaspirillum sp. SJZ107 TaxID=2572881 RepID=UPI00114E0684|nr:hypothetical protein [Herbaspirillum sp. SJZ107]TQK06905.1 hypothetical protein FBX97_2169 [Herbaspirillum sp. SJZ107]